MGFISGSVDLFYVYNKDKGFIKGSFDKFEYKFTNNIEEAFRSYNTDFASLVSDKCNEKEMNTEVVYGTWRLKSFGKVNGGVNQCMKTLNL